MKRKTNTIVGIYFNIEDLQEVLDHMEEKNFFSKNELKEFNNQLNNGKEITDAYKEIINRKNINNAPTIEILDEQMSSDEYFLGYRIDEGKPEIPTNQKVLDQINLARKNWFELFEEYPQTESVSFDLDE
jgi:hypothetical protein